MVSLPSLVSQTPTPPELEVVEDVHGYRILCGCGNHGT